MADSEAYFEDQLLIVAFSYDGVNLFDNYLVLIWRDDENATYEPILFRGKIVTIADWDLVPKVLDLVIDQKVKKMALPTKRRFTIDIGEAIDIIEQGSGTHLGYLLNLLNVYLDLLAAVQIPLSASKDHILSELAQWTFSGRPISGFYAESEITKEECLDAVYWLLGAVTSRMRIYDKDAFDAAIIDAT